NNAVRYPYQKCKVNYQVSGFPVKAMSDSQKPGRGENGEKRTWKRRQLSPNKRLWQRPQRIPFAEEQERMIRDTHLAEIADINKLLNGADNKYQLALELAAEATEFQIKNKHISGMHPVSKVISDRMNEAGFKRPDGYNVDETYGLVPDSWTRVYEDIVNMKFLMRQPPSKTLQRSKKAKEILDKLDAHVLFEYCVDLIFYFASVPAFCGTHLLKLARMCHSAYAGVKDTLNVSIAVHIRHSGHKSVDRSAHPSFWVRRLNYQYFIAVFLASMLLLELPVILACYLGSWLVTCIFKNSNLFFQMYVYGKWEKENCI
ncbi:hypothetical protein KI387_002910, partial [Taxus chinensis]